jgi:hypothetical protein
MVPHPCKHKVSQLRSLSYSVLRGNNYGKLGSVFYSSQPQTRLNGIASVTTKFAVITLASEILQGEMALQSKLDHNINGQSVESRN